MAGQPWLDAMRFDSGREELQKTGCPKKTHPFFETLGNNSCLFCREEFSKAAGIFQMDTKQ
jgi:hypothetical protein